MKKLLLFPVLAYLLLFSGVANAGKVEDVQSAVKAACSKDLPSADALRLVKDLFLNCMPGSNVDVEGCQVKCLKDNTGAVLGG